MSEVIDISLEVSEETIIYPGNPEVEIEELDKSGSAVSKVSFGSHTATHVDGPSHVFESGEGVNEAFGVDRFVGECRVLDFTDSEEKIELEELKEKNIKEGEIILAKTRNSLIGFEEFRDDFVYLGGEAAEFLAEVGIDLFGIDYLSVKERGSSDNRPHTELLENDIVIFEGLDLEGIEPGEYTFVGLPLKLADIDGAPSRAVLIDE